MEDLFNTKQTQIQIDLSNRKPNTSGERKVMMEARLETRPKSPRLEKITPSHQNSNCFHTWAVDWMIMI